MAQTATDAQGARPYAVRTSLAQSKLEQNVNPFGADSGSRYVSLGSILMWVGALGVIVWVGFALLHLRVSIPWVLAWGAWGFIASAYLIAQTPLREYRFASIRVVFDYWRRPRRVRTTGGTPIAGIMAVSNILDVRPDGLIEMLGGVKGYAYDVVGTASKFLFGSSQQAVTGAWDMFTRHLDPEVTMSIYTVKSGENVAPQLKALAARREALGRQADPELLELIAEQEYALSGYISRRFQTIDQILVLTSTNEETLMQAAADLELAAASGQDDAGMAVGSEVFRSARRLGLAGVRDLQHHLLGPLDGPRGIDE